MKASSIPSQVSEWARANGRKGGAKRSPAKAKAILENLAKARAKRWAKPKKAPTRVSER